MIAPCKDCAGRFVGCHASCPRYAELTVTPLDLPDDRPV
nr:MAG TPA: hypothetical protein [Caudoviricetes sp.]